VFLFLYPRLTKVGGVSFFIEEKQLYPVWGKNIKRVQKTKEGLRSFGRGPFLSAFLQRYAIV